MTTPAKMTTEELEPYAREYMRRMRAGHTPRAKVLAPCRYCGEQMGARARRVHEPRCEKRA